MHIEVTIEIPKGQRNKYQIDYPRFSKTSAE
jgi:inorganic pyrophosphatase